MASAVLDTDTLKALAKFPEMNPGPVLRFDRDGTILLANAAARAVFGSGDLLGRRWLDLCPGMTADLWTRVLTSGQRVTHEAEIGGACVMFTHVLSDAGDFACAFGADVTEHRRAQREVAEIARFPDMNPGPVLRLTVDGIVLLANAAARSVFGTSLVGDQWRRMVAGLDGPTWNDILAATGRPFYFDARVGDRDFVFAHRRDLTAQLVFVFGADVTHQRQTERALRQSEKMATLGTLAAGVAHELNNPAAATGRAAEQLREAFARLEAAHLTLDAGRLPAGLAEVIRSLEERARDVAQRPSDLDALGRADREAAVEEWLDDHAVNDAWELAPALVAAGFDPAALAEIERQLDGADVDRVLSWAASAIRVHALLREIANGSTRISEIVGALKSYSFLGQAPVQAVDLRDGIENTLIILQSKLKLGITVHREYATDLPKIPAYGSELNQVWTNLLDNAADAMGGKGEITIRTRRDAQFGIVEIEDTGPGIPLEVQSRVFDPFFTTKAPGKGTGLGLSTSYSIVTEKHGGQIAVESRPGFTRFTVRLPLEAAAPTGAATSDAQELA